MTHPATHAAWAMDEWLKKKREHPQPERRKPFNFFGKEFDIENRQYMPESEYEKTMGKRWRSPWHTYGKEPGETASVYPDQILRDEATRRSAAEQAGTGPLGFRQREAGRSGMPIPQASTTPQMVESMQSGMQPMDITRYYKERDLSFAGAMTKTLASGLAKAAKPRPVKEVRRGGGTRAPVEGLGMAGWTGPKAPSAYEETFADPSIETYLRRWRLKHGYI